MTVQRMCYLRDDAVKIEIDKKVSVESSAASRVHMSGFQCRIRTEFDVIGGHDLVSRRVLSRAMAVA